MRKDRSVRFWLFIFLSTFLVLQIGLSVYLNNASRNAIRAQSALSSSNVLKFYIDGIDTAFNNADIYFYSFLNEDKAVLDLEVSTDDVKRQFAKVDIYAQMNKGILLHERIDAFFFYHTLQDDPTFIQANSARSNYPAVFPRRGLSPINNYGWSSFKQTKTWI